VLVLLFIVLTRAETVAAVSAEPPLDYVIAVVP
jgi:hypothetical protein